MGRPLEIDERWRDQIAALLNGMEYGSVQITVHDGKIVQMERTERKRFDANTPSSKAQPDRLAAEKS
ncbi:hypothetical protein BVG16_04750 [Paenibacillus selenitireducens]|jgi:hypothetical protein|uniref:DUF2292 domain-containing protein n=1 Tax=Paenibacillus selenitireducens TaxID=1324314 RepID=A0A1T2XK58_9BACL|nr:YezD family protein [Paenibacillus selenitireducens]OPA80063.1 hypothetical protein BVG16_04750 [Paenibacillus selenitireducens]